MKNTYLLQNASQGYLGNSPFWWRAGGNGYTVNPLEAQQFSAEAALNQIASSRGTHDFVAWPLDKVVASTATVVDMKILRDNVSPAEMIQHDAELAQAEHKQSKLARSHR